MISRSRILVVDDEPQLADALGGLLSTEGYQARTGDDHRAVGAQRAAARGWRRSIKVECLGRDPSVART